ncbi:MAG: FAD-binding oxidoreductase [Christensenellales bacterium]|jgi:D-lactate dehydrogenase (cytochrome)
MLDERYVEYLKDESRLSGTADGIVFAQSEGDILRALENARKGGGPLTVQGSRTGITGAAVPRGGTILNLSRMNRITGLERDDKGYLLCLEPGVLLSQVTEALRGMRFDTGGWDEASKALLPELSGAGELFFPPDPTEGSACIGGMFAANARGIAQLAYGDTAGWVAAVGVLLPGGGKWPLARGQYTFTDEGCPLPEGGFLPVPPVEHPAAFAPGKGDDLLDIFAGSEGMLGVVSALKLRLIPRPAQQWGVLFFFQEEEAAVDFGRGAVEMDLPAQVCAVEFFDRTSLAMVENFKKQSTRLEQIPPMDESMQAAVYVELAADEEEAAEEALFALLDNFCAAGGDENDTWAASGYDEMEKFRILRHAVPESINTRIDEAKREHPGVTKLAADMAVPPGRLEEMRALYKEGLTACGISGAVFGHMAGGHLHVNLMPQDQAQYDAGRALILSWAQAAAGMGGRVAAENGVGKLKRELFALYTPRETLWALARIKAHFDPGGMLNPGNMLEEKN